MNGAVPDVDRAYEPIIERFVAGPHTEDGIRAAVVIGSRARTDHPADEWADLDIVIWSTDPARYLADAGWTATLGDARSLTGALRPRRDSEEHVRNAARNSLLEFRARRRIPRCSPHVLRHTFARTFLANGGDVFSLQRILGHSPSSLQVTRRHVDLLDEDLRAVHREASPVERLP